MKNKLLLCILFFSFLQNANSQCNLICNPTFDGNNPSSLGIVNPFELLMVPCWREASITPQIVGTVVSNPFAASMWSLSDKKNTWGEGIITANALNLIAGKQYIFAMSARNASSPGTFAIPKVRADFSNRAAYSGNVKLSDPMPGTQSILNITNLLGTTYSSYQTCVTPSQAWANVYIHLFNQSKITTAWLNVDDVELLPNFNFAGTNPFKKCDSLPVTIGGNCVSLHVVFTYRWWILGSGSIIGTTQQITVNPTTTTQYVCERNSGIAGCIGYDTVTVNVQTKPPRIGLGVDTTFCQGEIYSRYLFPLNIIWNLYLNGVYVSGDYIYITKTGQYILRNIDPTTGCENADTVNLIFRPELPHRDTVLYYCDTTFNKTICTFPGFSRYKWTFPPAGKNDTTRCITIHAFGKYIVKLTDSFGCVTYDTLNIRQKTPPFFNLPNDTLLCPGTSLTLHGGPGMLHYLWSTGDTTSSIIVTSSGKYILSVYTQDSCFGKDSVMVTFMTRPSFTLLSKSIFCKTDPCDTIKISPSSILDTIRINGVISKVFCPDTLACGNHTVSIHYTDSAGCFYDTSFVFKVICIDTPIIDSVGYLCLTDTPVVLDATPSGGTFSGKGVSGGVFYPGTAGIGWHWVKYCYTDSIYGCTICDSIRIKVVGITAQIIPLTDTARLCDHKPVRLKARGGNQFYWLHNASTDSVVTVTETGTYCVIVSDDTTGCPDTTCITIIYKNCCELEYTQPFADPNGEVLIQPDGPYNYLHDTLMVITGTVRVMPGATWTIVNSKIILKECARIIVENGTGGAGGIKAAKMYVYNSNLMGCDWQGIEVWGRFDDCNADTADNTAGGSELQGKLIMFGDSISDADMAIFVGRRNDATIGIVPWQSYAGGVIDIEQCVFKNNFADIVFSEYSVVAVACELNLFDCPSLFGYSDHLVSRVELNTFDTLKTTEDCTLFLSTLLSSPGGYYGSSPWHCHIINFSDNPVWTMGPGVGGPPPVYNPVCNKLMLGLFSCDTDIRKKFNNNTYYIPCAANTNIPIPCYQNNNGYK